MLLKPHFAAALTFSLTVLAGQGDTVPPTVSITAPTANATVSGTVPVSATASDERSALSAASAVPPTASADAPLLLSFKGPSWTEIRDASGQLLVSRLIGANSVEPILGAPPFDVVLGNAPAVSVTYRGKPVDLAPYTRQNVARFTLQ